MIRLVLIALMTIGLQLFQLESISLHASEAANDNDVLAAAKQANMYYQNRRNVLLNQLKNADNATKAKAIAELSTLQEPILIQVIAPFLDFNVHDDVLVKAACRGLARLQAKEYIDDLTNITKQPNASEDIKKSAWNALGRLKELNRVHFTDQSGDFETAIRASGITNLGTSKIEDAGSILADAALNDRRVHVRRMAAIGLGHLGDAEYAEALMTALTDGDIQVRRYAANALVKMDHKPAIPYLLIQLESNIGGQYLNQSLMILSGEDFGYKHTDTLTARRDAIARGFTWYTDNSKDF